MVDIGVDSEAAKDLFKYLGMPGLHPYDASALVEMLGPQGAMGLAQTRNQNMMADREQRLRERIAPYKHIINPAEWRDIQRENLAAGRQDRQAMAAQREADRNLAELQSQRQEEGRNERAKMKAEAELDRARMRAADRQMQRAMELASGQSDQSLKKARLDLDRQTQERLSRQLAFDVTSANKKSQQKALEALVKGFGTPKEVRLWASEQLKKLAESQPVKKTYPNQETGMEVPRAPEGPPMPADAVLPQEGPQGPQPSPLGMQLAPSWHQAKLWKSQFPEDVEMLEEFGASQGMSPEEIAEYVVNVMQIKRGTGRAYYPRPG